MGRGVFLCLAWKRQYLIITTWEVLTISSRRDLCKQQLRGNMGILFLSMIWNWEFKKTSALMNSQDLTPPPTANSRSKRLTFSIFKVTASSIDETWGLKNTNLQATLKSSTKIFIVRMENGLMMGDHSDRRALNPLFLNFQQTKKRRDYSN